MPTPITAKQITIGIYWSLRPASDLIIPRFTPHKWWECDVWRLTNNGYTDEYEIKLSLADYRVDAKKEDQGRAIFNRVTRQWDETPARNKHDLLANSEEGPNRFWFAVPVELASKIEVPSWAGLIVARGMSSYVQKQAPKRHTKKWDGNRTKLLETFYHRYCNHEYRVKTEVEPSIEP